MSRIEKFIRKVCVQTAVYWGNPVPDGFGGMTYDDPKEIKVRWDDTINVIKDNSGKEVTSKAKVLTPIDLDEQGYLFLGILSDLSDQDLNQPNAISKAFEIIRADRTPMIMSTDVFVRTVYL